MADSLVLTFEVSRGDEFLFREQLSAESVTIGKGPAAMLHIEDDALADLQAVINLTDNGSVQVLDLVGEGTSLNGEPVVNAPLSTGDLLEMGEIKILVQFEGGLAPDDAVPEPTAPMDGADEEDDELADASVHTVGDLDLTDKTDAEILQEDISEDVMAFIMRSGTAQSDVGVERNKPQVLEIAEIWGDVIMDVRHFHQGQQAITIGTTTGYRWRILDRPIKWCSPGFAKFAWLLPPTLSEAREEMRNDFYVPSETLPTEEFALFEWRGSEYVCRFSEKWAGFVDRGDERHTLSELIESGAAKSAGGEIYELPLSGDTRVILDIGHVIMFGQMVHQSQRVAGAVALDYPFLGVFAFMLFLGSMMGIIASQTTLSDASIHEIPDRFVELLLKEPVIEEHKEKNKPNTNPDAGEGAKAKKEEGKVGKKDAKMDKAKGNKVEIQRQELDREIAEDAGLLGQIADQGGMDGTFGNTIVDETLLGGIGGALGAKGVQMGSGGLGSRGSGLGGGGSASGLGGTGTFGRGSGSSGWGAGGGNFGAKSEGGIGRIGGDPIILGALDKSLIDKVIKRNMAQIRYCYQRELNRSPTLSGKIVVKFVISGDGSVSQAKTHSSTMKGGDAVQSCINSRFMRFQFPEPKGGGIVIVKYPFIFAPQ
jgi:hypothetical protein